MVMKNLAGNWLAGSTNDDDDDDSQQLPLLSSFLPCSRKKERKTPTPVHCLLMIIDDDYDSGPGFSFFQFYNIQTTAMYLFLLFFVVS
jgi:hypothetical protein